MNKVDAVRTDATILSALVADDRLTERERPAFENMQENITSGRYDTLTGPQRDWAERRYLELHLDADEASANLHSNKLVPQGIPNPNARHYEKLDRPMKPPGRS